ncbi:MAG: hypothetical protein ABI861_09730 [Panacibacter sp.]
MSNQQIDIIPSHNIDKQKWDNCIHKSSNGLIYATSTFLDIMSNKQWEALVMNDYETVMPLIWRKKWGIYYLHQPAFSQQLGVFSIKDTDINTTGQFLNTIPGKYRFAEINLNAGNVVQQPCFLHKNYLLNINYSYEVLQKNYSRSAKRNIDKALNAGITIQENINPSDIIFIHRKRFKDKIGAREKDYLAFGRLIEILVKQKNCFTVGAFNAGTRLISGSIYLLYKNRVTFIMNGNSPESFQCGATHLLKDYAIQKFSDKGLIMDFEGGDFKNFVRFYEQFGNTYIEYYPSLFFNKLPWPFKLLKKNYYERNITSV